MERLKTVNDDNISVFINTLTELARENHLDFSYKYDLKSRFVHLCFKTKGKASIGRVIITEEEILDSAFPAIYARTVFRQMLRQREQG